MTPRITPIRDQPVQAVVEALEDALAEAMEGRIRNVAIVAEASSGSMHYTTWGLENNAVLLGLLVCVQHRILSQMEDE